MLTTLGPDGWETLRQKPERILAVREEVEALGLTVTAQYALMGQYDFLNIIEAPDEKIDGEGRDHARGARHDAHDDAAGDRRRGSDRNAEGELAPHHQMRWAAALLAEVVGVEEHGEHRAVRTAADPEVLAAVVVARSRRPRSRGSTAVRSGSALRHGCRASPPPSVRHPASVPTARDPDRFPTLRHERKCWAAGDQVVVGIDEVGRGSWAGPVTVGAVVAPPEHLAGVKDSKLLTPAEREVCRGAGPRVGARHRRRPRQSTRSATSSA